MMPPERQPGIPAIVQHASTVLLDLDTGSLARLRRMDVNGPGESDYWQLASICGFLDGDARAWLQIAKIMALLTGRGDRGARGVLHDRTRGLGAVLCDGGRPSWSSDGESQPALSEIRFARFLSLPYDKRGEALERLARWISTSRERDAGVNCIDIARLVLFDDVNDARRLAESYYRRLDRSWSKKQENAVA